MNTLILASNARKRCNQCWQWKNLSAFQGPRANHEYQDCSDCRARRRKPIENHRIGLPIESELRVTITERSKNRKLGPIPSVSVTASTCPPSCAWFNRGCYGEQHISREHWRNVEHDGVPWAQLVDFVEVLPAHQLWRYAEVGDLPGRGETVDWQLLWALESVAAGTRGFTFTHKRAALGHNTDGFTINQSADNLEQADTFADWGPTVVVLPTDAPDRLKTPRGRQVVVCHGEVNPDVTCSRCGLCARKHGRPIIGFRAHGLRKREVSDRARLRVLP